jgi:predicted TIM-barrel fold metal-dependent hydrolase
MIIDGHAHACGEFLTVQNIIKILDANQVDKIVLVPGEKGSDKSYGLPDLASAFPTRDVVQVTNLMTRLAITFSGAAKHLAEENQRVYSFVQAYPKRIIQFYWALVRRPNILQELETHYLAWQFKGVKVHQCWENFSFSSQQFEAIADFATQRQLPIFIHAGSNQEVKALIGFIKKAPQTRLIIGHLFGLELYIQSGLELENVFFEISSPSLISHQRLLKAIRYFGAEKIILGSDTPYGLDNLRINIERVKALPLSDQEKTNILGGNMQRILGL